MPLNDDIKVFLRELVSQFSEQLQGRQFRYSGQVTGARDRLEDAILSLRDSQRQQVVRQESFRRARRLAPTVGAKRQVLVNVKLIRDVARANLAHARATGVNITGARQAYKRAESRVKDAQARLQEARTAKKKLPELRDQLIKARMEVKRNESNVETKKTTLEQIKLTAGAIGAAREGLGQIAGGVVQGTQRGSELGGLGGIIQGVGSFASAIPGVGGATAGAFAFAGSVLKATDAINKWSKSVTDSNMQLYGHISPAMAAVRMADEFAEMQNAFIRGQNRAEATGRAARARRLLEREVTGPLGDMFSNATENASAAINETVTRAGRGDARAIGTTIAGAGVTAGSAGLGGIIGGVAGSFILPGLGTAAGAAIGASLGGYAGYNAAGTAIDRANPGMSSQTSSSSNNDNWPTTYERPERFQQ